MSEQNLLQCQDWVNANYLDRQFRSTAAPKIPTGEGETKEVVSVREAKYYALKIDPEDWATESLKVGTWQNKVAFEIGISLQRLGSLAFFGAIPIGWLLHLNSDQIIDDWLLCRAWIKDYQDKQQTSLVKWTIETPFHRRHAEWIALAASIWMSQYCSGYKPAERIIADYDTIDKARARLENLTRAEFDVVDAQTLSGLSSILVFPK